MMRIYCYANAANCEWECKQKPQPVIASINQNKLNVFLYGEAIFFAVLSNACGIVQILNIIDFVHSTIGSGKFQLSTSYR